MKHLEHDLIKSVVLFLTLRVLEVKRFASDHTSCNFLFFFVFVLQFYHSNRLVFTEVHRIIWLMFNCLSRLFIHIYFNLNKCLSAPGCLQEAWTGAQGEASSSAIRADEGDGPAPAAGWPAAWGTGSRGPEDQGRWIFSQRPPLHLCKGTKIYCLFMHKELTDEPWHDLVFISLNTKLSSVYPKRKNDQ